MKKLFTIITAMLFAGQAYATAPCGTYQPSCVDYPYGLDELLQLDPNHFDSNGTFYSGFAESEYDGIGLDEYIAFIGEEYDGSYSAPPNALTVQAIKELKAIVDTKIGGEPEAAIANQGNATGILFLTDATTAINQDRAKINAILAVLRAQGLIEE